MSRYLDPKNDLTFKRVFGEHKELCISLLNGLLPLEEGRVVTSIEYLSNEQLPRFDSGRNSIVDVRCVDSFGRIFIVEMQMYWTTHFENRVLFNGAKAIVSQLPEGAAFSELRPVYALNLVNQVFAPELPDDYYHHYKMVNTQHPERQIKGLEMVFVELPKFKPSNRAERKLRDLWLEFLTEVGGSKGNAPEELMRYPETRLALECVETAAYTRAQLLTYDKYWDAISIERTLEENRRHDCEVSRKEGLEEGRQEGRAEGRAEGEEKKAHDIAVKLAGMGLTADKIAEATGLSIAAVEGVLRKAQGEVTG